MASSRRWPRDVHLALAAQQGVQQALEPRGKRVIPDDAVQNDLQWPGRRKTHRYLNQQHAEDPGNEPPIGPKQIQDQTHGDLCLGQVRVSVQANETQ